MPLVLWLDWNELECELHNLNVKYVTYIQSNSFKNLMNIPLDINTIYFWLHIDYFAYVVLIR